MNDFIEMDSTWKINIDFTILRNNINTDFTIVRHSSGKWLFLSSKDKYEFVGDWLSDKIESLYKLNKLNEIDKLFLKLGYEVE